MGNLGGGEILVILLVALIVLGPTKLPPAVRQVGKVVGEIRRIGQGFQQELREAAKPLQEATADLKAADKSLRETTQKPLKEMTDTIKAADPRKGIASLPANEAKDTTTSGKGGDASGTAAATAAAAGPVSWGTAEARVSPPPAASSEDTEATADAAASDTVKPTHEPDVEPVPEAGVVKPVHEPVPEAGVVKPTHEPAPEPAREADVVEPAPEPAPEPGPVADAEEWADTAD